MSLKENGKAKENRIFTTKNIVNSIGCLVYVYLFLKVCLNLCYGTESMYQVIRDGFNYRAVFLFLCMIFIAVNFPKGLWGFWESVKEKKIFDSDKNKFWNIVVKCKIIPILVVLIVGIIGYRYFTKNAFEQDIYTDFLMQWHAKGMCLVLLVDNLLCKRFLSWKKWNKAAFISFILLSLYTNIFTNSKGISFILLCPFIVLYLTDINKDTWRKLINALAISFFLAVAWVMFKSIREVPVTDHRYKGVFLNLSTIGVFCGGGFVASFYWILREKMRGFKDKLVVVYSIIAMAFSGYLLFITGLRTSQLGAIVAVIISLVFVTKTGIDKSTRNKRMLIAGGVVVLMIAVGFAALFTLYRIGPDKLRELVSNDVLYGKLEYWRGRAGTMFNANSRVFKDGTLIAAIDRFSSGRLGIWTDYFKSFTLFGNNDMTLQVGKTCWIHPHNTYLAWLAIYGYFGTAFALVWFVLSGIKLFKNVNKDKDTYLLPFIWFIYAATVMLTESINWIYPAEFVMLFLVYTAMTERKDGMDN